MCPCEIAVRAAGAAPVRARGGVRAFPGALSTPGTFVHRLGQQVREVGARSEESFGGSSSQDPPSARAAVLPSL